MTMAQLLRGFFLGQKNCEPKQNVVFTVNTSVRARYILQAMYKAVSRGKKAKQNCDSFKTVWKLTSII